MKIQPKVRGFICTTAHPIGCREHVKEQIEFVKMQTGSWRGPKNVLIIGASTGYGLASRIVAGFGFNAKTIGVFFEREAQANRTASAGWYNTAAFEQMAIESGLYAKSINGDAFSAEIKQRTIELIKQDFPQGVDLVIYSLASPRRQDPTTGEIYNSVLKPVGCNYNNKTVDVMSGVVSEVNLEPANDKEIADTIKVMGGQDWQLWINALETAGVLAKEVTTVAYSYVGPELTNQIYRHGTIGLAKEDLEKTAIELNAKLQQSCGGRAFVSINKGLVTQASSAIPVVPLYFALLYKVMKRLNLHEGTIEQIWRLFTQRLYAEVTQVDELDRIRIDEFELRADVQEEVAQLWQQVTTENLAEISDLAGYKEEFYKLFGFGFPTVDYEKDLEVEVPIPSMQFETA